MKLEKERKKNFNYISNQLDLKKSELILPQRKLFLNNNYLSQFRISSNLQNELEKNKNLKSNISPKILMEKRILKLIKNKDDVIFQIENQLSDFAKLKNDNQILGDNPFKCFKKSYLEEKKEKSTTIRFCTLKNKLKENLQIHINLKNILQIRNTILQNVNKSLILRLKSANNTNNERICLRCNKKINLKNSIDVIVLYYNFYLV